MKAAIGPYIAAWNSNPTVIARMAAPAERVSTSGKYAKPHTPTPTAPNRYTGRRPTRSESAANPGIATSCTTEATRTPLKT